MKFRPVFTVLVGALLALLLLQQLSWAGHRLMAELWAFPAVSSLEWWDEWDIDPADAEWQPVHRGLKTALRYMPDDPELLAYMGDLYTQRLSDDALTDGQEYEAVAQGSQTYLNALKQRPTWVRDWDDLALIKYNQASYTDTEYQLALRQIVRFGAKRRGLMELLVDMSITSWAALDNNTRMMIVEHTDFEEVRSQRSASTAPDVGPGTM